MMTANEIRTKFLTFFESKGHKVIASDSVVPKDDPTVLFTTAGMQQFKRQFLGQIDDYRRAATCQKCLRTDDLDKIGKTPVHHTFFEMLGNFSFGDYFKKDAIAWAWEFFTKELKIPEDKLWVSVYTDDDEAYNIWLNDIKLPKNRILKLGDKDNFWPAEAKQKGPNGPCGPCSEIFFDFGVNPDCKSKVCDPTCNCGRFAEVWNLVFTQYNRKEGGILEPLPGKNIDTGMGLERLVAVIQGKKNNYETDLFIPIRESIRKETSAVNAKITEQEEKIISDHVRAIAFGINDGVIPSNEGRGYVIKKLIIDSSDLALKGGAMGAVIYRLVPTVVDVMKGPYPEIVSKQRNIADTVKNIEESYIKVCKERIPELINITADLLRTTKADPTRWKPLGDVIFKFRDTFGLTLPTIRKTIMSAGADENDWTQAKERYFASNMEEQQKKSRASSKMTGDVFAGADLDLAGISKTEFLGYDKSESNSKIVRIFVNNQKANEAKKGDAIQLVLDKTPFYAESGGQIGDTGYLSNKTAKVQVLDTQKTSDVFIHNGTVAEGTLKVGDTLDLKIDSDRRLSIMRNHTATHILQATLREILGSHVQQQGSLVSQEKLRFDFTHPQGVGKDQLSKIESIVNDRIQANDKVEKKAMPIAEAKKSGALAFFAEKYGETVRVVSIDGYSKEFCGGTHLNTTGEIMSLKIIGESAVAQGIRRIEAVTGTFVDQWLKNKEDQEKTRQQSEEKKKQEKETRNMRFESIKNSLNDSLQNALSVNGISVFARTYEDIDIENLRKISDLIKQKLPSSVIILGSESEGTATILVCATDEAVKKGFNANDLIKQVAPKIGGSGGGRPQLAQAGGKEPENLKSAIEQLTQSLIARN